MHDIDWNAIRTENDVAAALGQVFGELGLSGGVFAYTPISSLPGGRPGVLKRVIGVNLDTWILEDWYVHRAAEPPSLSQAFDPIRRRMSQKLLPERLVMRDLLADRAAARNVAAANFLRTLIKAGIRESFHTPIFTGRGEYWSTGGMRFADHPDDHDLSEEAYAYLHWVTARLADIAIERLDWRSVQPTDGEHLLTPRELDCLFWAAHGHVAGDTAEVLDIGAETVRRHLKNAMRKLGARSKTQAVVEAHRLGYLPLI